MLRKHMLDNARRLGLAAIVGVTALAGLAACGGDDSSSSDTTVAATTPAPATTSAPTTTAAVATTSAPTTAAATTDAATTVAAAQQVDLQAFCQAELAAEAAANGEDPSAAGPAFEALQAVSPPEVEPAVDAVIAAASSGDTESDEFNENYATMISFVKANCGFADLELTTTEYQFGGVPQTLDAGPVVITNHNIGGEFHEVLLLRVNDGVTESVAEIAALPEEEAMQKATVAGVAFAAPGATGYSAVNLEPGHYAAICFLPQGATPEHMAAIEAGEFDGAPHFTLGMLNEFDVE